jgi:hypothetical protein
MRMIHCGDLEHSCMSVTYLLGILDVEILEGDNRLEGQD